MLMMTFRMQTLYALAVPLGRKMANIQNLLLTAFVTGKIDLKRYLLVINLIHTNIDKEQVFF